MPALSPKHYAWLSIAAALATIALKAAGWWFTGSVGLLSDALESVVNLAGALMALAMILVAELPADDRHAYGHGKAEYFSSGFEGLLILVAALAIGAAAIERLWEPRPLEQLGAGLAFTGVATLINWATARALTGAGRRLRCLPLEADAAHLMTDVWTSLGVIGGVAAVGLTGWLWLDPLIALVVAANIVRTGGSLLYRATQGLMDVRLPAADRRSLDGVLERYRADGIDFHALRTRASGSRRFVELHVLVPGEWTVQRGHELLERLEAEIRAVLPQTTVLTHLEPLGDPAAQADIALDRIEREG